MLAQEDALVAAATQQALQSTRTSMGAYEQRMVEQIHAGTRAAFSASITHMLSRALWIVVLGLLVIFFIPELPLRSRMPAASTAES
jgi:hypothetical protein